MEKVFDLLSRQAQVSTDLLDKMWISALVNSLLHNIVIAFGIFVAYRFVQALDRKWTGERENAAVRKEADKLNAPFVHSDDSRYMPRR